MSVFLWHKNFQAISQNAKVLFRRGGDGEGPSMEEMGIVTPKAKSPEKSKKPLSKDEVLANVGKREAAERAAREQAMIDADREAVQDNLIIKHGAGGEGDGLDDFFQQQQEAEKLAEARAALDAVQESDADARILATLEKVHSGSGAPAKRKSTESTPASVDAFVDSYVAAAERKAKTPPPITEAMRATERANSARRKLSKDSEMVTDLSESDIQEFNDDDAAVEAHVAKNKARRAELDRAATERQSRKEAVKPPPIPEAARMRDEANNNIDAALDRIHRRGVKEPSPSFKPDTDFALPDLVSRIDRDDTTELHELGEEDMLETRTIGTPPRITEAMRNESAVTDLSEGDIQEFTAEDAAVEAHVAKNKARRAELDRAATERLSRREAVKPPPIPEAARMQQDQDVDIDGFMSRFENRNNVPASATEKIKSPALTPEALRARFAEMNRKQEIAKLNGEIKEALELEQQVLREGDEEGSERLAAIDEFLQDKQAQIKALENPAPKMPENWRNMFATKEDEARMRARYEEDNAPMLSSDLLEEERETPKSAFEQKVEAIRALPEDQQDAALDRLIAARALERGVTNNTAPAPRESAQVTQRVERPKKEVPKNSLLRKVGKWFAGLALAGSALSGASAESSKNAPSRDAIGPASISDSQHAGTEAPPLVRGGSSRSEVRYAPVTELSGEDDPIIVKASPSRDRGTSKSDASRVESGSKSNIKDPFAAEGMDHFDSKKLGVPFKTESGRTLFHDKSDNALYSKTPGSLIRYDYSPEGRIRSVSVEDTTGNGSLSTIDVNPANGQVLGGGKNAEFLQNIVNDAQNTLNKDIMGL